MREYAIIRDEIKRAGATLLAEHLSPEHFGSAYCTFEGRTGMRFRLVWDGKEGYGFLETPAKGGSWSYTQPFVSDVSNPKVGKFAELLSLAQSLTADLGS